MYFHLEYKGYPMAKSIEEVNNSFSEQERTNLVAYNTKKMMRGTDIGFDAAKQCMEWMIHRKIESLDTNFGAFFAAMTAKGPTKGEIVGCTEAVLNIDGFMPKQETLSTNEPVYSICGSGKTDYKIFNVSTAAAFIASAAEVCVTKQGSYGTSKSTGSADVVAEVGAELKMDQERMKRSAEEDSIAFFTISDKVENYDSIYGGNFYIYHPLSYGFPALINKVNVDGIVYGTMSRDTELVASILQEYGFDNTVVVNSKIKPGYYMDEFSIFGENKVSHIHGGEILTKYYDFADLTDADDPERIRSGTRHENTKSLVSAILGVNGPKTDVACLNAGAVLFAAQTVDSIEKGYEVARQKAEDGGAYDQLRRLVENTDGDLKVLEGLREECLGESR